MIRIALAFALGLTAVAVPARAADVATIGCVDQKITPSLRQRLSADIEKGLLVELEADPAIREELLALGRQCRSQFGWSEAATTAAVAVTRAGIGRAVAEKVARARGIDVGKVLQIWMDLPFDVRKRQITSETLNQLGAALTKAGIFKKDGDGALVGKLVAFYSIADFSRQDFIDG